MCQHLGVSKSGYYAWQNRGVSQREIANRILVERIRAIYLRSDSTYGRPRIQAELRDMGACINHKRIARLMRMHGLRGVSSRRGFVITTERNRLHQTAPDLVSRKFVATDINQLWVADMTYIPT